MQQWFYQMLGEEFGPISTAGLQQLVADGTLADSDLVRPADSPDWMPLSAAALDAADVLTDLSELQFQFEESGNSSTRSRRVKPPEVKLPPVTQEPEPEPQWFHQFAGQVLGPVKLAELLALAESGGLSETDQVRSSESIAWQAAGDVPELAAAFILSSGGAGAAKPVPSSNSSRTLFAHTAAIVPPKPPAPSRPAPAPAPVSTPAAQSPAATAPATSAAASSPAETSSKTGKNARGGGRKSEEKLVDSILSEVFSEPEAPRTQASSPARTETTSTAAAPAASSYSAAPAYSPPPAPAPAPTPAPRPSPASYSNKPAARSKSSGGGLSMPSINANGATIVFAVLALLAASWFGYGPVMRFLTIDEAKYMASAEKAVTTLEQVNPQASETELYQVHDAVYKEFNEYVKAMHGAGSTGERSRNCLAAMNRLMEVTRVNPARNPELRKKLLDEAKKLISMWKSQ
jgi:hypothetical protein